MNSDILKKKENRTYDEIVKEARSVIHKIAIENIPELCRALRDGDMYDFDIFERNDLIKAKIMYDMRGVLFPDKVYDSHGIKILPTEGGREIGDRAVYKRIERRLEPTRVWNRDTNSMETEMRDNHGRGDYVKSITAHTRARDLSPMAKFVEQIIDKEISSWTKK